MLVVVGCGVSTPGPSRADVDHGKAPAKAAESAPQPSRATAAAAPSAAEPAAATEASPAAGDFSVRERIDAAPPAVVVVSPGDEPRAALSRRGRVGERRTLRLSIGMEVAMDLGARKVPPSVVPPLVVTLAVDTTAVDDDAVTLAIAVTDVASPQGAAATPRVRDAMARTAARLRGTRGSARIGPDGGLLAFDLRSPDPSGSSSAQATPSAALEPELGGLAIALQELLPSVPATTAVGAGATWTSVRHVRRDAVRMQQSGTWTLGHEGDDAVLSVISEHVATRDEGGAAAGMVLASSGTTTARITLGAGPLPLRASATVETRTRADLELIGAAQRVTLRSVITLDLWDLDAPQ